MDLMAPTLNPDILNQLIADGLVREGHFTYRSGRHSGVMLDRDRLLADPRSASRMGYALAKAFFTDKIDTVASPSVWGAGLAQWVAYFLEPRANVVYATPMPDGSRAVADNLLNLIEHKRILLVDNILVSGETMQHFDTQVQSLGGTVLGIGALWIGGDVPTHAGRVVGLLNDQYPSFEAEDCPYCRDGHATIETVPY